MQCYAQLKLPRRFSNAPDIDAFTILKVMTHDKFYFGKLSEIRSKCAERHQSLKNVNFLTIPKTIYKSEAAGELNGICILQRN